MKKLGEISAIPKYKGDSSQETRRNFLALASRIGGILHDEFDLKALSITTDDQLDAIVGLANAIDLISGADDWLGNEETGYFLILRIDDSVTLMRLGWSDATKKLLGN